MRHVAPGDRVYVRGDLTRTAGVHAGPLPALATAVPVGLDTILVSYPDEPTIEVWRKDVIVASRAPDTRVPCSFCQDKPLPNAARWIQREAPATATCPRCGVKR